MPFDDVVPSRHGAAVSFDRSEEMPEIDGLGEAMTYEAAVDAEGIPFPE